MLVIVLSLGIGVGANTAIFSLVDAVILKALPVKDPSSINRAVSVITGAGVGQC